MTDINKEAMKKAVDRALLFREKVDTLVDNNKIIGKESTITDVLALFKEFNVSEGYTTTRVINRVLGGEQK